jgi:hypothetical protein
LPPVIEAQFMALATAGDRGVYQKGVGAVLGIERFLLGVKEAKAEKEQE